MNPIILAGLFDLKVITIRRDITEADLVQFLESYKNSPNPKIRDRVKVADLMSKGISESKVVDENGYEIQTIVTVERHGKRV